MYSIGDKVAHPMHGAGVIDEIVERTEKEGKRRFYSLRLCVGAMTLMLPCDGCELIGLREALSQQEANALLEHLEEIPVENEDNWNQRYRENMVKIKSGDLQQVGVVIRTLRHREMQKHLSTGERKMLSSAKKIFISELALVLDRSYEEIEHIVDKQLI